MINKTSIFLEERWNNAFLVCYGDKEGMYFGPKDKIIKKIERELDENKKNNTPHR